MSTESAVNAQLQELAEAIRRLADPPPEPQAVAPVGEPVIDVAAVVALGRCLYALTDPSGRGGDYEIGYEAGTLAAVSEVRRLIAAYDPENPALRDVPYAP